ncbi:MAG: hypothetical protein HQK49_20460 [Oligoflexia bacterium]|nr:hypothetical protein [Oligoflexia bacterium]
MLCLLCLSGCGDNSSTSTATTTPSAIISTISETKSVSSTIVANQGGTVTLDDLSAIISANRLPTNATIRISKVAISNDRTVSGANDVTSAYVLSTTSSTSALEINNGTSITLEFKINNLNINPNLLRLVFWNGSSWVELASTYNSLRQVVTINLGMILPYGTTIYYCNKNGEQLHAARRGIHRGNNTVSEFVALKVVSVFITNDNDNDNDNENETSINANEKSIGLKSTTKVESTHFTVSYSKSSDAALAEKVSTVLENAYTNIVTTMGFKSPGRSSLGDSKWPVFIKELDDAYGRADSSNYIEVASGTSVSTDAEIQDLSHSCHHEFFHLVQYQTLRSAGNGPNDGLSWFDETSADAIGYYAKNGIGVRLSDSDSEMGYFNQRLDHDAYVPNNEDYEYNHYPFIEYILETYGYVKFRNFFETFYSYRENNKENINLNTIDRAANATIGKNITGTSGIFWDFYRDYFIAGVVFNKNKFLNLGSRNSGTPMDITDGLIEDDDQGVTLVDLSSQRTYASKDFKILRLSGQVILFRYNGNTVSGSGRNLTINIKSTAAADTSGRIQLHPYKRVSGALQIAGSGSVQEVLSGENKSVSFTGLGTDIHDIYVVLTNTSHLSDDYVVTISAELI